jgi:hypothetical protein
MGRLMLALGWMCTLVGCVVAAIGLPVSLSTIVNEGQAASEAFYRPLLWVYALVINGALNVLFWRTCLEDAARSRR